jgi:hypothetical protein
MICMINVGRWVIFDRYRYNPGDVVMLPIGIVQNLVQSGFVTVL